MRLEGKVAIITGGNRGIGAAMVRLFSAEGARVVFGGGARSWGARSKPSCATRAAT